MDSFERPGRERHRSGAAGDRQPVRHVRRHRLPVERLQLVTNRDSLIELPQLRRPQDVLEIELPDEHDLQQLLLVGLEVRQDPNLLEHLEKHRAFAVQLADMENRVDRGEPVLTFELMESLKAWLECHILKEDMKYAAFLAGKP